MRDLSCTPKELLRRRGEESGHPPELYSPPVLRRREALATLPTLLVEATRARGGTGPLAARLGCYVGFPHGNDARAMAVFERRFDGFVEAMGGNRPRFMNAFVDFKGAFEGPGGWVDSARWQAWSWNLTTRTRGIVPVLGVPMARASDWDEAKERGAALSLFDAIAAGRHDGIWRGIAEAWRDNGWRTVHFRPGYEMNGEFMPWRMGKDAASATRWALAFRRIASVIRVVDGLRAVVHWNPALQNWERVSCAEAAWPGDAHVDAISLDVYDSPYPADLLLWNWPRGEAGDAAAPDPESWRRDRRALRHYFDYPSASRWFQPLRVPGNPWSGPDFSNPYGRSVGIGLRRWLDFARTRGKPVAICEMGTGDTPDGAGLGDSPLLPELLAERLIEPGAPPLLFANLWDVELQDGDWRVSRGERPRAAAAWRVAFGTTG